LPVQATPDLFDLGGRVVVVTGGAGLLGEQHASAIAGAGGTPVLLDVDRDRAEEVAARIAARFDVAASTLVADVTDEEQLATARGELLERHGRIDGLINNAANDPKVDPDAPPAWSRLESLPREQWDADIEVGLTGAFLCSRMFGSEMARRGGGVVVNVASDLALIAPDQRLYRQDGVADGEQPVKPVSYVVVKTALLGLTRYLATYWAAAGVRVNALSPAGVFVDQPDEFVRRFSELVPLGRMARRDEYHGAIVFLCSDASSFMTGQNLVVDGGRTAW
jgi:NAD(P)-dependent dehydrogenase (short-subunit alcohol dehydrogenase family)